MHEQNKTPEKQRDQESTLVFSSLNAKSKNEEVPESETSEKQNREPSKGPIAAGTGIGMVGGLVAGTVYSEQIKEGIGKAKDEMANVFSTEKTDHLEQVQEPVQAIPVKSTEINETHKIQEIHHEPVLQPQPVEVASAPTQMGVSHTFDDGRVFQITFTDVNHDGQIDNWTASATDITGNTQYVTGTGEQLSSIFTGEPSYAQQIDYVDEQTPIADMEENFESIDWASSSDQPMQELNGELVPDAEFNASSDGQGFGISELDEANYLHNEEMINPDYQQEIIDNSFESWEVPESYSTDSFSGPDDFVTAQFI